MFFIITMPQILLPTLEHLLLSMSFNPCFDFAYKWRQHALLRNASRMPRTPGAFVGNSSMKSHRRFKALRKSWSMSWSSPLLLILSSALEALIGIWPQECNVLPPIKAAIVFMEATNWNSTPCCQCRHSWKKRRQRWMHVLFPAPGIPWSQEPTGSVKQKNHDICVCSEVGTQTSSNE